MPGKEFFQPLFVKDDIIFLFYILKLATGTVIYFKFFSLEK